MEQQQLDFARPLRRRWGSYCFMAWLCAAGVACQNEKSVTSNLFALRLNFQPQASGVALQLNAPYTTPQAEPLTITAFKYYVSNLALVEANGNQQRLNDQYFLVDAKDPGSQSVLLALPGKQYTKLRLLVGVDSPRNVSGVQTGALDPANGMFWSWNTGYIMAKLEGKSAMSKAPQQGVTFHIGGFKASESVLAPITLDLPKPVVLGEGKTPEIVLGANALAWFAGAHPVKIADSAFCMTPGVFAQQVAANYRQMFTVLAVNN
jgi:hypothetical protein